MSYEEILSSNPKAKKPYPCCWCGEEIKIGEKHLSRKYKFCGEFNADRMHFECEKAMYEMNDSELQEGWTFGSNPRGANHE